MKAGEIWKITLGRYSDKYLVVFNSVTRSYKLRRVSMPKTKIDATRLPEYIDIDYFGVPLNSESTKTNKR